MIRLSHVQTGFRFLTHRFHDVHPFEAQVQLLNACDKSCVYCRCPDLPTALLTTDQWQTVLRSLGKLGMLRVKFQGGEPTLRSDFRELCATAKNAGIRTATISHGAKIATQPELLDYLDELVISLDSIRPEVNDSLRGLGSFQSAIQAIDISQKRGIKTYINMAVCQTNFSDVEGVLKFCETRGILMNAQPIVFGRRYYDDKAKPIGLSDEQIRALHLQLADWKKQGRNLLFSPQAYLKALSWPGLPELSVKSEKTSACPAGKDFIHIDPNGDVSPCIQHAADFRPKNILVDGLMESLRHARTHNCEDCWPAYLNERKALFRLKPHALREMIRRS